MRFVVLLVCFEVVAVFCGELDLFGENLSKAFCLAKLSAKNAQDNCHENSISTNCSVTTTSISSLVKLNEALKTPQLICKSIKEISLSWDHSGFSSSFLELSRTLFLKNSNYTQPTTCNRWILTNLQPDTSYKIRRWEAWIENSTRFLQLSTALLVKTVATVDSLLPISGFKMKNLSLNVDSYDAIVRWIPAPDMPCRYRLDAFGVTTGDHISKGVVFPFPPYEERISGLKFGHTYNLTIRALSPSLSSPFAESPPSYTVVDIPSCLATYSDLTICVPPPPENVTVSAKCGQICDVTVSWSMPELIPDAYLIFIYNFSDDGNDIINVTVPGTVNSAIINNLAVDTYEVIVKAVSQAGNSEATVRTFTISPDDSSAADVTTKLAVALGVLTTAIALLILLIVLKRRHARKFGSQINNLYSKELLKIDSVLAKPSNKKVMDEWEVSAENIVIEGVLGEGAFGLVKKGLFKKLDGQFIVVGVKMLKPHASSEEARQLFQEITIMKSVGTHPNLVSMIGCVTEGSAEGPLLLVEFCPNGDLQTLLRKEWERLNNFYRDTNQAASEENDYNVFNKAYVFDNTEEFLTPNDLLSFARQIALGMEHLSKLRVLHRDLAARNVLVCDNKLVKVADFGLSRDVYQNNVYCKLGGGKLPIRWMALESITHQRYTTHSDVWSFGVLLWEIVTLGEYPYPEVSNADLLSFLKSGCRMEKPPHCGLELYQIMLNCWKENPKERPSFTEIRKRLEVLLEDALNYVKL